MGKLRAVVIGINYTNDPLRRLEGAVSDAKRIKMYLEQQGFEKENIILLCDDSQAVERSLPTRQNIIDAIQWLVKDAEAGDSLFFYFGGHGGFEIQLFLQ